jgi:hypothetical protein
MNVIRAREKCQGFGEIKGVNIFDSPRLPSLEKEGCAFEARGGFSRRIKDEG